MPLRLWILPNYPCYPDPQAILFFLVFNTRSFGHCYSPQMEAWLKSMGSGVTAFSCFLTIKQKANLPCKLLRCSKLWPTNLVHLGHGLPGIQTAAGSSHLHARRVPSAAQAGTRRTAEDGPIALLMTYTQWWTSVLFLTRKSREWGIPWNSKIDSMIDF